MKDRVCGYNGKLLRVDLTTGVATIETLDAADLRKYLGGTGLGVKILYDEVPPSVGCFDPENRLILASGPLGGTRIGGSGTYSVVTLGALTGGATTSQANGYFGAYLRFSGFDAMVVQGAASDWVYLYMHDGQAEIKDAKHLLGMDTFQTEEAIRKDLNKSGRELSVAAIGPAGENQVRFAMIESDRGHVAAHNGPGAVMGSKKLKGIAVSRSKSAIQIKDPQRLSAISGELLERLRSESYAGLDVYNWGTLQGIVIGQLVKILPVNNYQTSDWGISEEELKEWSEESIRGKFGGKKHPCWACQFNHCFSMKILDGPYAGKEVEEPEYEGLASCGPVIGNTDVAAAMVLIDDIDRLGMDVNETGWVISFVMECYQKGILTKQQLEGLEMTWGNVEAARALAGKIARREGIGDMLAEGVMRAAQKIGGEAPDMAIHTAKGNTPRTHDHRIMWYEMFDTCVSNCGTIETQAHMLDHVPNASPRNNPVGIGSPDEVSAVVANSKGAMQFQDSLGICDFNGNTRMPLLAEAVNAATGWDMDAIEAMSIGRRAVNLTRLFNLKRGIGAELDRPSPRYGSTPVDGLAAGVGTQDVWNTMLEDYYGLMGWDKQTGIPLPETLEALGLAHLISDLP
ncbi:MAG: aldehyde ferredoxin oxidoreductase C-terminal domain-containing protein [Dehalococcoidia bacterium]